ncbi:TPA: DEAD/DEAH box helicase family protein [Bacillus cereus]|nr:DEAD/DEAH box helicase family protein [Bacillus cereus]
MNKNITTISSRLSLRKPQRLSLEILSNVLEILELGNKEGASLEEQLDKVMSVYPSVTSFERDFPSLCFALATGVGKTRLMGAFISYLYKAKGLKNFFVLAPNLTIYNKLIEDFTPNTSKYVFKGISEFIANPPIIITGDNYEEGIGVRKRSLFGEDEVHINIFNISKINSEVRGGRLPKIKRLSEYIGESYFDYLATLPDLVLLMDESHRYRASAGVKVLNELNPILGMELTATPQVESKNKTLPFKNIIYSFPLNKAIEDGFVKEPAVATRENFDPDNYSEDELERIKLEDGIKVHEETKVELKVYAKQNKQPIVKPFVLVVAQDTTHAESLLEIIQSNSFFDGRYKDKVITVHSNLRGEEKDENVQQLMKLEDPETNTEIVIHVNMLKEGWDVTNLYTIIPLRAANSKTLVEQSIGRGLRLPYGKRTGVKPVDRLTIIAHDNFQSIVDEANKPNSIIRSGLFIGKDIAKDKKKPVVSKPVIEDKVLEEVKNKLSTEEITDGAVAKFDSQEIKQVIQMVQSKVAELEYLPNSRQLNNRDVKSKMINEIQEDFNLNNLDLFPEEREQFVTHVVETYLEKTIQHSIDIPKIIVEQVGDLSWGYNDFDLDTSNINLQPISENILIQHLRTHDREILTRIESNQEDERLEDILVSVLMEYPDISYEDQAELLYKLSRQLVSHLFSYLPNETTVKNVLLYNRNRLGELVYLQMKDHYFEHASSYQAKVNKGFETLQPVNYTTSIGTGQINFREPVLDKSRIKGMVFSGFIKCLYKTQKFDSDSERRFSVICENDISVEKWFKPSIGQLKIYYGQNKIYNPDFVVETKTQKLICEIKRSDDINDDEVQKKANAVIKWCNHASGHETENGGKMWRYLLIPHSDVKENMTIEGLMAKYLLN